MVLEKVLKINHISTKIKSGKMEWNWNGIGMEMEWNIYEEFC